MEASSSVERSAAESGETFEVKDDNHMSYDEMEQDDSKPFDDTTFGNSGTNGMRQAEGRNRGSPVWKYFFSRRSSAVCKLCEKSLKRSRGNTSSLFQHLKHVHHRQYATMMEEYGRRKMAAATRHMVCLLLFYHNSNNYDNFYGAITLSN